MSGQRPQCLASGRRPWRFDSLFLSLALDEAKYFQLEYKCMKVKPPFFMPDSLKCILGLEHTESNYSDLISIFCFILLISCLNLRHAIRMKSMTLKPSSVKMFLLSVSLTRSLSRAYLRPIYIPVYNLSVVYPVYFPCKPLVASYSDEYSRFIPSSLIHSSFSI